MKYVLFINALRRIFLQKLTFHNKIKIKNILKIALKAF